jgi:tetratricopeptide (TPR) repeat protein
MVLEGEAEIEPSPAVGQATLETAIERAESCGHDRMVARAATELVWAYGFRQFRLAERSASLARGAIARLGGDSRLEGWLANNLVSVLLEEGRLDEARAAAEQAIEIKSRALGPEHLDTANSIHNLALILSKTGELRRALEDSERALAIFERWSGPNSVLAWMERGMRAEILGLLGQTSEAETQLRRVLAWLDGKGISDVRLARTLQVLGTTVLRSGRTREAIPFFERALRLQTDDSPSEIAETEFGLAKARDAVTRGDREALALAEKAAAAYATSPYFDRQRGEITAWLASHHPKRK